MCVSPSLVAICRPRFVTCHFSHLVRLSKFRKLSCIDQVAWHSFPSSVAPVLVGLRLNAACPLPPPAAITTAQLCNPSGALLVAAHTLDMDDNIGFRPMDAPSQNRAQLRIRVYPFNWLGSIPCGLPWTDTGLTLEGIRF